MKVRVWNAYASNNSGSYTIVGELPSREVARETAEELRVMVAAETVWREAWDGKPVPPESPLEAFCKKHALGPTRGWDDWPEHSADNTPAVLAVGRQVIVHHDYTVSLPTTFGEFFYKQGGRVEHEENHAHHPIVTFGEFWWSWTKEERARMAVEAPRLIAALIAPDSALSGKYWSAWPPAWQSAAGEFGDPPFTVGVIFDRSHRRGLRAPSGGRGARRAPASPPPGGAGRHSRSAGPSASEHARAAGAALRPGGDRRRLQGGRAGLGASPEGPKTRQRRSPAVLPASGHRCPGPPGAQGRSLGKRAPAGRRDHRARAQRRLSAKAHGCGADSKPRGASRALAVVLR